jgi:hypothetical protein
VTLVAASTRSKGKRFSALGKFPISDFFGTKREHHWRKAALPQEEQLEICPEATAKTYSARAKLKQSAAALQCGGQWKPPHNLTLDTTMTRWHYSQLSIPERR